MKNRIQRRDFLKTATVAGIGIGMTGMSQLLFASDSSQKKISVGIIGLSVHTEAFSEMLNAEVVDADISGFRVVAIYHPKGNPDVEFKADMLADWAVKAKARGIELVDSVDKLQLGVNVAAASLMDASASESILPWQECLKLGEEFNYNID